MMNASKNNIKDFYTTHPDRITEKREKSPYPLRRYVHAQQYESIARFVESGMNILDNGCGEGSLSFILAQKGVRVTGCDISRPNIDMCMKRRDELNISSASFLVADSESLPFPDNSFDLVVSSHVLEHLPDFDKGLQEIMRVTKKRAIVAIPTILNPCSLVQIGHGWFWLKGPRSFLGFFYGLLRLCVALVKGDEGVDENYAGHDVPHMFRFPSVMRKKVKHLGFHLISYEADCICSPYFEFFLPFIKWLNRYRGSILLRNCGYGTLYVIEK